MYIVLQVNKVTGKSKAHGPFGDKRNARRAEEWLNYGPWDTEIVPLIPINEGTS